MTFVDVEGKGAVDTQFVYEGVGLPPVGATPIDASPSEGSLDRGYR
jgi:hypothetical protein